MAKTNNKLSTKGKIVIVASQVAVMIVLGTLGFVLAIETWRDIEASRINGRQAALSLVMVAILIGLELTMLRSFVATLSRQTSRDE